MQKLSTVAVFLALFLAPMGMMAQQPNLPTVGLLGASFNQTGSPRWNLLASAIYQQPGLNSSWYASTSVDGVPIQRIINGKPVYSLSLSIRQGENYVLYRAPEAAGVTSTGMPKLAAFVGADIGAGFSQASPVGTNVNWAAAGTVGVIGRVGSVNSHWGWAVIARAIHLAGDSTNQVTPIVEAAIAYKFQ